jgi:hypothetical protein
MPAGVIWRIPRGAGTLSVSGAEHATGPVTRALLRPSCLRRLGCRTTVLLVEDHQAL